MGRLLGIIWMIYALLGGVGLGLSQVLGPRDTGMGMLAGAAVPIFSGVLFVIALVIAISTERKRPEVTF